MAQGVAYRPEVGDELFEELKRLGQESSLIVLGIVVETVGAHHLGVSN